MTTRESDLERPPYCRHCGKHLVQEDVGWRSDERNPAVDRVLCPGSMEPDARNKKHQPAAQMRRIRVFVPPAWPGLWTGGPA